MKKRRFKQRLNRFKFYDLIIYAARGSHSARRLASSLSCRRWRDDLPSRYTRRRPYFRGNRSPMVINWGSTVRADWLADPRFSLRPIWVNDSEAVRTAIDKVRFFKALSECGDEVPIIRATTDIEEAKLWLKKDFGVVARKTLLVAGGPVLS